MDLLDALTASEQGVNIATLVDMGNPAISKRLWIMLAVLLILGLVASCVPKYTLTFSVYDGERGNITVSPSEDSYDAGTKVTITAKPASGYHFVHWSGDASGSINPIIITMDGDKDVSAHFAKIYTLTTSISPNGGGSVTPSSGTYDAGTKVTITAKPASGYAFDHWSGDATGTSSSVAITMDSDKRVTAHFKPGIGSVVSGDVWQVKVVSVKKATTLQIFTPMPGKSRSVSVREGYSFLIVKVQIQNVSTEWQEYHSRSITLTDSEKRVYTFEGCRSTPSGGYHLNVTWEGGKAPESSPLTMDIVFVVPDDAKGLYFKFLGLPPIDLGQ